MPRVFNATLPLAPANIEPPPMMDHTPAPSIAPRKTKDKIGKDGLTRAQRYYRSHPDLKEKNRQRQRDRRKKLKLQEPDNSSFSSPQLPPVQASSSANPTNTTARRAKSTVISKCKSSLLQSASSSVAASDSSFSYSDAVLSLCQLRGQILDWTAAWGGLSNWPWWLERTYSEAFESNSVSEWKGRMADRARIGRRLLSQLKDIKDLMLPQELYEIREIWGTQIDLAEKLITGITLIQARCSIIPDAAAAQYNARFPPVLVEELVSDSESGPTEMESPDDGSQCEQEIGLHSLDNDNASKDRSDQQRADSVEL